MVRRSPARASTIPAETRRRRRSRSEEPRLNSSHTVISYAVFCLKKKKHTSELQSHSDFVCRLLLEKKKKLLKKSFADVRAPHTRLTSFVELCRAAIEDVVNHMSE